MGMGMRPSMPAGIFSGAVGSGAQYEMTTADGTKSTIEYAVVGKESVDGKDAYWLEWTMTAARMGEMVMKMLLAPESSNGVTSRIIMQMAGRPPMEMPAQMTPPRQPACSEDGHSRRIRRRRQRIRHNSRRHIHVRSLPIEGRQLGHVGQHPSNSVRSREVPDQDYLDGAHQADHRRTRQNRGHACAIQSANDDAAAPISSGERLFQVGWGYLGDP